MEDEKEQNVDLQEVETEATAEVETQEIQQEQKDNNIDNVLNSVSDEYLRKKKHTRKITYSTILSVLFALATIIIVMSTIRVDLKPSFVTNPSSYSIYISGSEKMFIDESSEEYEEFYKTYTEAFNVSYLTALFTGKLGGYEVEETLDKFYSTESTQTGMSQKLSDKLGNNYIKLSYATEHQIKNSDGSVYYSDYNTTCDLKFEDVYFPLNTENKDAELTFYFGTTGIGVGYTITTITVRANTNALYEFAK